MKQTEIMFCRLIRMAFHPEEAGLFTPEDIRVIEGEAESLFAIARIHDMQLALYESVCNLSVFLPDAKRAAMQRTVVSYCMGSYQMLFFVRKVLSVLAEEKVNYILLKGVSLLACYPKLEFRGYGDVDILVSDQGEFEQAKKRFLAEGFYIKEDFTDHQLELFYEKDGRRYLLELHNRVIGSQDDKNLNNIVVSLFSGLRGIPAHFDEAGLDYFVFPDTENTVYLLLHMLQHFLNSGFGVKLLCDWTAYIEAHCHQIDWESYDKLVASMGLTGFSHAMAQLCIRYFGLPATCIPLSEKQKISEEAMVELMDDILAGGEFGRNDTSRMLIMARGTSPLDYLMQFHRQMKLRFPKAHPVFVLWPVLWLITGICFWRNNHTLRKTSTREVLAMTRKRQGLLRELRLFQKNVE